MRVLWPKIMRPRKVFYLSVRPRRSDKNTYRYSRIYIYIFIPKMLIRYARLRFWGTNVRNRRFFPRKQHNNISATDLYYNIIKYSSDQQQLKSVYRYPHMAIIYPTTRRTSRENCSILVVLFLSVACI